MIQFPKSTIQALAVVLAFSFLTAPASYATLKLCGGPPSVSSLAITTTFDSSNNDLNNPNPPTATQLVNNSVIVTTDNFLQGEYGVKISDTVGTEFAPANSDLPLIMFNPFGGGCIDPAFNFLGLPEPWFPNFLKAVCTIRTTLLIEADLSGPNVPGNPTIDGFNVVVFRDPNDLQKKSDLPLFTQLAPVGVMPPNVETLVKLFFNLNPAMPNKVYTDNPATTQLRGLAYAPATITGTTASATLALDLEENVTLPPSPADRFYKIWIWGKVEGTGQQCYVMDLIPADVIN